MSSGGFGDLTIKDRAVNNPGCCIFTGSSEGEFLDLGRRVNYVEPHAYVHVPFVKEMGRAVGMVDPAEVEKLRLRNEELRQEVDALSMAFDALSGAKQGVAA